MHSRTDVITTHGSSRRARYVATACRVSAQDPELVCGRIRTRYSPKVWVACEVDGFASTVDIRTVEPAMAAHRSNRTDLAAGRPSGSRSSDSHARCLSKTLEITAIAVIDHVIPLSRVAAEHDRPGIGRGKGNTRSDAGAVVPRRLGRRDSTDSAAARSRPVGPECLSCRHTTTTEIPECRSRKGHMCRPGR